MLSYLKLLSVIIQETIMCYNKWNDMLLFFMK